MVIKFGLKAKKCCKKHDVESVCQDGTDTVQRFEFYRKNCNKMRTEYWWRPKIINYFSRLTFRFKCFIFLWQEHPVEIY